MLTNKTTRVLLILLLIIHVCRCEFITESKDLTYFVGEKAELNCTVNSFQEKHEYYYWIRDNGTDIGYISRGTDIFSRDFSESKYRVCRCDRTFTLQISDLKYEDAAAYYCGIPVNRTNMISKSQTTVLNVLPSRKGTHLSIDVYNMTKGFYFVAFITYSFLSFIVIGILSVCLLKTKADLKSTCSLKLSPQCKNKPNKPNREPQDREIDLQDDETKGYIQPMARLNNFLWDSPREQHNELNQKGLYDDDEWDDEELDYENTSLARKNINRMSDGYAEPC